MMEKNDLRKEERPPKFPAAVNLMASINGIILKAKKFKDGSLRYNGGLFIKKNGTLTKIADWEQGKSGRDFIRSRGIYDASKIKHAIAEYGNSTFEDNMYYLATAAEYEDWYKRGRKNGYAGLAIIQCDSEYVGKYLKKSEAFLSMDKIEGMLAEDERQLGVRHPTEKTECIVFTNPLDFVFGEPVDEENLIMDTVEVGLEER